MNQLRSEAFIKIKHSIMSCENQLQLDGMRNIIIRYHQQKKKDSAELLAMFIEREAELNPETI